MRVTETLTFDEYWLDTRFILKRANLHGSTKQAFGDNIYHRNSAGRWSQEDSHHSLPDGTANMENVNRDTRVDRVLVSDRFTYWGGYGPEITARFRDFDGVDVCVGGQGHRCKFAEDLVGEFLAWLTGLNASGYVGRPGDW